MHHFLHAGLAICIFFSLSLQLHAHQLEKESCEALYEFIEILDNKHVAPPFHDAEWAAGFTQLLLNDLDPHGLYLTEEDISQIQAQEELLLADLEQKQCKHIQVINRLFGDCLQRIDQVFLDLEQAPFKYAASDTIIWRPASSLELPRAKNEADLLQQWEKRLKYLTLYSAFNANPIQKTVSFKKAAYDLQLAQIQQARCELRQISEYEEGFDTYLRRKYMDAMSASYDPHSGFYSLSEKELWDLALSTQSYSFGLEFERNREGALQVSRLSPGGPAWRSRGLHIGDEILEIEYPKGHMLDIRCLSIQALVDELNSSQSPEIFLQIKKRNGEIRELHLEKERIQQEEHVINSYILQGERKIGYIYLPAFYTASEDEGTDGCADDVARELLRLQAEKIEGLILDLRYNGGGSMKEAINLAGIFVDRGPLAIYEERDKVPTLLRDMNRGSFYQGPLVLLINGLSASASEILASALQDYERAIIVGSSSFGKSSGQIMLPVVGSGLGMVKVSIQRYYRITGKSYQLNGVVPDISLPSIDDVLGPKERDYLFPFTHTFIDKPVIYKKSGKMPYKYLREKSLGRVIKNPRYRELKSLLKALGQSQKEGVKMVLAPKGFPEAMQSQSLLNQDILSLNQIPSDKFRPENNLFTQSLLQLDPSLVSWNEEQKTKIHQDLYVEEAFSILDDLIRKTSP